MRHSAAGMLHQLGLHRFCSDALDGADIRSPVGPGPHHVTQRGNRRAPVFFEQADYASIATSWGSAAASLCGVWAYCLMPNHVHLILVPATTDGLARAIGETHRQYTGEACPRLDRG